MSNSSDICDKIAEIRLGNKKILVSETENENGGLFSYAEQNGKVLMAINKSFGSIGAQKQNPDGGRLYPSYTSDYYDKILKSKTDILGKKILVQKGDPSYEKVVDLLPPLQEAYTFLGDKEYHYRPLPRIDWNGSIGGNGFLGFGLNGKPIEYGSVKHSLLDGYLPAIQFIYLNEKEQIGWEEIGTSPKARLDGFKKAHDDYGAVFKEKNVIQIRDFHFETGIKALRKFIDDKARLDAVFSAAGDMVAMGILKEAHIRKISIPEDLAIVGFDDIETASIVSPALTTVRQPISEIGQKAFRLAVDSIQKKVSSTENIVFEPKLITRGSA